MLTSITPLGERSRGFRWETTVASFAMGAGFAGAILGAGLGWLGQFASVGEPSAGLRLSVFALILIVGLVLDLGVAGLHLPTVRRQVNEDWLHAYRGWVYGLSFGAQLGLGLVTIATSSTVYITFLAALLSASPAAGAVIGATFGLLRSASLLPARRVRQPSALLALGDAIRRFEFPVRNFVLGAQAILAALALVAGAVA